MAENTQLIRPSAGQSSVLPVGPDARLEFKFIYYYTEFY